MYKVDDYVMYKKEVCKVKEIKTNKMTDDLYYILVPISDSSLIIDVPTDNRMGYLKDVMSKKEADELIEKIPNIEPLQNIEDKYIEKTYKDLLHTGSHEDLIKIIKTTYLRNEDRMKNNRKISEKDSTYFEQAEKYLYNEISISLDMTFDDAKDYIIKKVKEIVK